MMGVQKQLDPLLGKQGEASGYFKKKIGEAYNYNLPAIKNAAALEAGAYALPGQLMDKYDTEYGGKTGVGGMARMNSILKNLGSQFGMSNAAWNLVDKNQMRMDEVVKGVTDQYMGNMDALKTKWGMLNPLWSTMYGEEQANARAAAARASDAAKWKDIKTKDTPKGTQPTPTSRPPMTLDQKLGTSAKIFGLSDTYNKIKNSSLGKFAGNLYNAYTGGQKAWNTVKDIWSK